MDELAALVEESRVVFVPFNNEPFAFREARGLREVVRAAADQVTRVQAVVLEDPREQGGRRGLAVRAANDKRALATDKKFFQQFRKRAVTELVIQDILGFGIA